MYRQASRREAMHPTASDASHRHHARASAREPRSFPRACENATNAYACARKRARALVLACASVRACSCWHAGARKFWLRQGRCLGSIGRQLRRDFEREQQQRLADRHGEEGRNVGLLLQAIP